MIEWIKNNKAAMTSAFITVLVASFIILAQGCDLAQLVKVDVPRDMKVAVDVEDLSKPISLAEAEMVWADWQRFVESNSEKFRNAVDSANERYTALSSITNIGLEFASQGASTLPGGAFLISGLTLITGLFLKRPGEDKRVSAENESSFNAGLKKAVALTTESKEVSPS